MTLNAVYIASPFDDRGVQVLCCRPVATEVTFSPSPPTPLFFLKDLSAFSSNCHLRLSLTVCSVFTVARGVVK